MSEMAECPDRAASSGFVRWSHSRGRFAGRQADARQNFCPVASRHYDDKASFERTANIARLLIDHWIGDPHCGQQENVGGAFIAAGCRSSDRASSGRAPGSSAAAAADRALPPVASAWSRRRSPALPAPPLFRWGRPCEAIRRPWSSAIRQQTLQRVGAFMQMGPLFASRIHSGRSFGCTLMSSRR